MAKKNNVVLENIELRPQVIGKTYKKKSNFLRVIVIFAIFILAVYYINDISVFLNNLLGRNTANTISNGSGNNTNDENDNNEEDENDTNQIEEVKHYVVSDTLSFEVDDLSLNNFKSNGSTLTFDVKNNTTKVVDLSKRKYFLETYLNENTLVERFKINFKSLNGGASDSFRFNISKTFNDIVIIEKSIDDYPVYTLNTNDSGVGKFTCRKDIEAIEYTFLNNDLQEIKHRIVDNNISDPNYTSRLSSYQSKVSAYNNIPGITATINNSDNGYTVTFNINPTLIDLTKINESYYYDVKQEEAPKVIHFEMTTNGFNCN